MIQHAQIISQQRKIHHAHANVKAGREKVDDQDEHAGSTQAFSRQIQLAEQNSHTRQAAAGNRRNGKAHDAADKPDDEQPAEAPAHAIGLGYGECAQHKQNAQLPQ